MADSHNDSRYSTFLCYYDSCEQNFPQALGRYVYSLNVNNDDKVELVVEEPEFGKEFFIGIGKDAIFENFILKFEECVSGTCVGPNGEYDGYTCDYSLLVSNNEGQENLFINTTEKDAGKKLFVAWKEYDILVLKHDSADLLKLKVVRKR